jgi:hypothetical protein
MRLEATPEADAWAEMSFSILGLPQAVQRG